MAETNYFRFTKVPSGDMLFGKTLNDVLDNLDEQLHQNLGYMQVLAEVLAMNPAVLPPAPGWAQVLFTSPMPEIIFADAVTLKKVRVNARKAGPTAADVNLNFALASAPAVPLLATDIVIPLGPANLDAVASFPVGVTLPADEELILIGNTLGEIVLIDVDIALTADVKYPGE